MIASEKASPRVEIGHPSYKSKNNENENMYSLSYTYMQKAVNLKEKKRGVNIVFP